MLRNNLLLFALTACLASVPATAQEQHLPPTATELCQDCPPLAPQILTVQCVDCPPLHVATVATAPVAYTPGMCMDCPPLAQHHTVITATTPCLDCPPLDASSGTDGSSARPFTSSTPAEPATCLTCPPERWTTVLHGSTLQPRN